MSYWWYIGLAWAAIIALALAMGRGFRDTLKRQPLDGERKDG